jgi:hypothetical protein
LASLMTLTPLVVPPNSTAPLPTLGSAAPCPTIGTGVPSARERVRRSDCPCRPEYLRSPERESQPPAERHLIVGRRTEVAPVRDHAKGAREPPPSKPRV